MRIPPTPMLLVGHFEQVNALGKNNTVIQSTSALSAAPTLRACLFTRDLRVPAASKRLHMTGSLTLRDYPDDVVRLNCAKCGRAGQYRKYVLIERFGPDIRLPDLREEIA